MFFDVGGVLLGMDGGERRSLWPRRLGILGEDFDREVWSAIGQRDKDCIGEVTEALVQRLGVAQSDVPGLLQDFSAHWRRNDPLVEFLGRLRGSYRLAIVSNVAPSGRFWFQTVLRLDEVFEAMFLSGELGVEKPDPAIYEIACSEMNVTPETSVFVDDLAKNVEAARALGMAAYRHVDNEATICWLKEQLDQGPIVSATG